MAAFISIGLFIKIEETIPLYVNNILGVAIVDYQYILDFAIKHNIENRTQEGFINALRNYKEAQPEEYSKYFGSIETDKLHTPIEKIALTLGNWPACNDNHIVSHLTIYYQDDYIASYRMVFNLDGTVEDDILSV